MALACPLPLIGSLTNVPTSTSIVPITPRSQAARRHLLPSAEADPVALKGSIRLAGNGGLFAFCGWFRNSKLGVYRAFCTDLAHAVVLRFPDRTVVVTPDQPDKFVAAIRELK